MAESVVAVKINVDDSSLNDLERGLQQAKEQLADLKIGDPGFKQATKNVQQYERALAKVNNTVEGFTLEKKIELADGAIKTMTGALGTAVGALGALGVESEVFGEFEKKAASFISLTLGLKDMSEGLGKIAKGFSTAEAGAKSFGKGAKIAIASTGIGLLVVALGTIVAYWDEINEAISGVSSESKDLLETQQDSAQAAQDSLDSISQSESILKLQGKTEREILNIKMAATSEAIAALEAQLVTQRELKKAQVETAEKNKLILKGILDFTTQPIQLLLKGIDAIGEKLGKDFGLAESFTESVAGFFFNPEKVAEKADESIKETEKALLKLKNQRAGYQLSVQNIDEKAAETAKNNEKKKAEELDKLRKEIANAEANTTQELRDKQIADTEKYYQDLIDQATKAGIDTVELEKSKGETINALKEQFRQEDYDAQKAIDDKALQDARDKQAAEQELTEQKLLMKLQLLDDIAYIAGEETAIGKAALIAQQALLIQEQIIAAKSLIISIKTSIAKAKAKAAEATVDSAAGAAKTASSAPFPANVPLILGYAVQAAAIIASVKSAYNTMKDIASNEGAGGGGTLPSTNPTVPTSGRAVSQSVNVMNPADLMPRDQCLKTYVVSGDVRSSQEAEAKIQKRRTV